MTTIALSELIQALESGARPQGGVDEHGDVLSIGAEHLSDDGRLELNKPKRIPRAFFESMSSGKVAAADILIVKDGATTGKVALVASDALSSDAAVNEHVFRIALDTSKADPAFVFRFLQSPRGQAQVMRGFHGATVGGITRSFVDGVSVPIPSLPEQRRIAAMFDKADGVRRKRREGLRLLDELQRSVFLQMFGDPVRNEKGWEVGTIGEVVTETQYGTGAKANSDGVGLRVLRMNNITSAGALDLADLKWCDIPSEDLIKYTVRRGDLLFNRTNSPELVGKTAVWDRDEVFAFAGYLIRVRLNVSRALPEYVSGYLNSSYGKRLLFEKAKPSNNMSNLSASELRRLPIFLPPVAEQARYAELVAATKQAKARLEVAQAVSGDLFDSVEQRVFGKGT